ncbi:glutamate--cysteine ligase [Natronincola peptidivorans]|uniref:Glutamate--cysteine ligase n=1 Tax=Natronincola peptidivorans TaxID=426128 RepID=A0A1I0ALZ1_9FIRM|nr:glutamate-cysteine ligase family protein [Natronincola peptidivorans]SES95343.1 glutamate--cysteine ligase [Natronincola peptidivorans]
MEYEKQVKQIAAFIKSGEKPEESLKIGVELEHIIVKKDSMESVTYYEEEGIESILKKLIKKGYEPKYEGDYVVGLGDQEAAITLEPGGQLEISIKPCSSLQEVETIYLDFLKKIIPILEEQNQLLMAIGYHPKTSIKDIPFNPKKRYGYMAEYFQTKGIYAHNMMKGTASLQVVIDYKNEEDFIKKFRVANFLSPLLHLITDNAPVFEGHLYKKNSIRSTIWENTDKDRSSIVPNSLNKTFGYEDYAKYILDTPPIFIMKDGEAVRTYDKKAEELINADTTEKELDHILSMVFPDVRIRTYIEIRMGDALPYPLNMAYVALIKGIFYNDMALNYLYELAKSTEEEKVRCAKKAIEEKGFEGRFKCKAVKDFVPILFDLAKKGLDESEKPYLLPLEKLIINKKNPALVIKSNMASKGMEAFKWCGLNQFGRE